MNDQNPASPATAGAFRGAGLCAALLLPVLSTAAASGPVQFNRDIRSMMSENCFACHGPDANARKAGLRLDTKEGLFEKTPKRGPAVVAGKPEQSELWKRITATSPDDVMPPPESHKTLKPEQRELFKQWILGGATWQGHWAYLKPERPAVPDAAKLKAQSSKFKIENPIDAFVLAKLQSKGLKPNSEADRRTLARRVSLDITGLPPTQETVEAFVKDKSPDAYGKLVKQLMASSKWGEHRARYWLDAARYADTHGLHFDNYREMWPYRDWVIKAFNSNMRFNVFTIKQLAGDLLASPETDDLVASGFQRCNMTTNEGGTIDEENLANYANDRVTTTGWVFLGMTLNCAACHDHKFDPILQKDFYAMEAFYRNTTQPPKDGNSKDSTPSVLVPQTPEDAKRWAALPKEMEVTKKEIDQRRSDARPAFTNWIASAKPEEFDKDIPTKNLTVHVPLNERVSNTVFVAAGPVQRIPLAGTQEWVDGRLGPALVLNKTNNLDLGDAGDFDRTNAFSYGAWVRVSKAEGNAGILARMDVDKDYRGWDLYQNDKKFSVHIVSKWPDNALKVSTKADTIKEKTFQHVFVTYDGSGKAKGVKIYVDGVEAPLKVDSDKLKGTIRTPTTLRVGQRSKGHELERGRIQDVRVYSRKLDAKEVSALAKVVPVREALTLAAGKRTKEQNDSIFDYWLITRDPVYVERDKHYAGLKAEQDAIKERNPITHVQREKTNSMPMANILFRGQYDKPKDKVTAATPGVLHAWPKDAPTNRLGLAQWTISPENPLTARVTVNRFWQEVFGIGLVKNAEDFGTTSEPPSNQDLLDWLAVEFVESGWDVKHMFELMVMSSAYRQSADVTPEKFEKDPQNRLLSRGPRFRMDAEMVRDYALAVSGLLTEKIGGPSVKPYQPDGLWEAVAMPESNTKKYKRDTGDALYRRSLYTFWKRAAPPATMDIFNAPSREVCSVRRERTNTPLQALATLNDPQFVEAARVLAEKALATGRRDDEALDEMAQRLLARPLTAKEKSIVKGTLADMNSFFAKNPDAAKEFLATGESKPSDKVPAPQLAAMTMVANQLMNLDEVLNK
jgi:mono/diheme cytochrome c family protein